MIKLNSTADQLPKTVTYPFCIEILSPEGFAVSWTCFTKPNKKTIVNKKGEWYTYTLPPHCKKNAQALLDALNSDKKCHYRMISPSDFKTKLKKKA